LLETAAAFLFLLELAVQRGDMKGEQGFPNLKTLSCELHDLQQNLLRRAAHKATSGNRRG
jgi:hypothetical protein